MNSLHRKLLQSLYGIAQWLNPPEPVCHWCLKGNDSRMPLCELIGGRDLLCSECLERLHPVFDHYQLRIGESEERFDLLILYKEDEGFLDLKEQYIQKMDTALASIFLSRDVLGEKRYRWILRRLKTGRMSGLSMPWRKDRVLSARFGSDKRKGYLKCFHQPLQASDTLMKQPLLINMERLSSLPDPLDEIFAAAGIEVHHLQEHLNGYQSFSEPFAPVYSRNSEQFSVSHRYRALFRFFTLKKYSKKYRKTGPARQIEERFEEGEGWTDGELANGGSVRSKYSGPVDSTLTRAEGVCLAESDCLAEGTYLKGSPSCHSNWVGVCWEMPDPMDFKFHPFFRVSHQIIVMGGHEKKIRETCKEFGIRIRKMRSHRSF